MKTPSCHNCLYSYWDPCLWLASVGIGFPHWPVCANHPDSLGQMRPTPKGGPCRNYRPRPSEPAEGARRIPVSDGLYAYVDAADYEWLGRWTWHLQDGYAVRWEKGKKRYMHRQIMQPPEGMKVDHANRNRLDNTRSNLRVCTHQQNMYNRVKRAGSISRFKGVGFRKRDQKWYAEVGGSRRPIWLGFFDTEIEAARAYDYKAVEHFGEFANVNFPEEWPAQRRAEVYAMRHPAGVEQESRKPKRKTHSASRRTKQKPRRPTAHKSQATVRKGRQR
ncbi:MAG: HNH endonuclease [Phycisphaerales bacterium]